MERSQITPAMACTICRSLVSVMEGGFGPHGSKTMICSATGRVFVTADGRMILEALNVSHPLAKTVVKSASSCSVTAGGCKTFIFYITGALEYAEKALYKYQGIPGKGENSSQSKQFRLELSHGIQRLLSQYLVQGLTDSLKSCFLHEQRNKTELQMNCSKLLKTELSAHFTPGLSDFFTQLLAYFLFEAVNCSDEVRQHLNYLVENYSDIAIKIPNQPYTASKISQGVWIQRNFACELPKTVGHTIKLIVLKCTMEGVDIENADGHLVHVTDADILEQSLDLKQQKAKYLLEKCLELNVQLVLSTEKVLQSFLFLCRQNCIAVVDFVPMEIAESLTSLCNIELLYRVEDLTGDHIGSVKSCGQVQFGRTTVVEIIMENPFNPVSSRQIVICAPTDGLCAQSNAVLYKALKTLSMAFERSPFDPNDSNSDFLASQNRKVLVGDTTDTSISMKEKQSPVLKKVTNSKKEDHYHVDVAPRSIDETQIKLFTIPCGGTFEFFVEDFLNSVQSSIKDSAVLLACDMVKKAVARVPLSLYFHACTKSTTKIKHRLYLEIHKDALQKVHNGIPVGINYRTGNLSILEETSEAVSGKISTLFNSLQLLGQILRTDSIVSVRTLPYTNDHDEQDQDDWP